MPALEHITCTRCNGSGKFSFNAVHGDMCYGCKGTGYNLTKRGEAALAYLLSLRKVNADQIVVGDLVQVVDMFTTYFVRVNAIQLTDMGLIQMTCLHNGDTLRLVRSATESIRKGWSGAEKAAQLAKAVEYQATLTKAGKVSKQKLKATP